MISIIITLIRIRYFGNLRFNGNFTFLYIAVIVQLNRHVCRDVTIDSHIFCFHFLLALHLTIAAYIYIYIYICIYIYIYIYIHIYIHRVFDFTKIYLCIFTKVRKYETPLRNYYSIINVNILNYRFLGIKGRANS